MEAGSLPLYRVSYHQLSQLASVLGSAGDQTGLDLPGLAVAGQCDLLVTGMLNNSEDYAEVPPVDDPSRGQLARDLLRWALTGDVPEAYRPYARSAPLLARHQADAFTDLARDLEGGSAGPDLASYGTALLALAAT